jgi:predicted methyltransferase
MVLQRFSIALMASLACPLAGATALLDIPPSISAAVAEASRPAADAQRDANRRPAEVLAYAGLKPGDRVGELLPGRGYFTRILCRVVGDAGHVYTIDIMKTQSRSPAPAAASPLGDTACTNITASFMPAADLTLPGSLDVVWTSENYHDLHNPNYGAPDMKAFNKVIFDALKPGGVFMVEDHVAEPGSGTRDTNTLHRIDPATAIAEVTTAGFVLEGQSTLLSNPADPHTELVLKLEGRTDKFLLKFRKPAR